MVSVSFAGLKQQLFANNPSHFVRSLWLFTLRRIRLAKSEVYEGIMGMKKQHWRTWSRIQTIKRKLKAYNWSLAHIHPTINKAVDYLAYKSTSMKTKNHHFNHFVGILKFDAVSYP
ncbi:unnamed protein product, partial [Cuscuta europaea]